MAIDYAKGNETRRTAGARAVGLLSHLVEFGHVPGLHLDAAKEIILQWDTAFDVETKKAEIENAD